MEGSLCSSRCLSRSVFLSILRNVAFPPRAPQGVQSPPTHIRSYQRYLNKFTQAINQRVFGELFSWLFSSLVFDNYTLDFDSTVMGRKGNLEETAKGYNPKRPGRLSHHPLPAFVSEVRMVANFWLRLGNTSASTNYLAFLDDTLARLQNKQVGLIRMDSGFFSREIPDYLEENGLHYITACRFNNRIKFCLTHASKWLELAMGLEISETTYQANGWESPRRIVMVRQEIEKRPKGAGKQIRQQELFENESDFGKCRYSCYVTDLELSAKIVYDSYRGRADSENRIKELKQDFSIDDFVSDNFLGNRGVWKLHHNGIQSHVIVPARLDQLRKEAFPQDHTL